MGLEFGGMWILAEDLLRILLRPLVLLFWLCCGGLALVSLLSMMLAWRNRGSLPLVAISALALGLVLFRGGIRRAMFDRGAEVSPMSASDILLLIPPSVGVGIALLRWFRGRCLSRET